MHEEVVIISHFLNFFLFFQNKEKKLYTFLFHHGILYCFTDEMKVNIWITQEWADNGVFLVGLP